LNNVIKFIGSGDSSMTSIDKLALSMHNYTFFNFISVANMQNIRCLISLGEECGLHGSGSVSGWDKERRLRPLLSWRKWEALGGCLTNYTRTIINITLPSNNFFPVPNVVRVIKSSE
jgi:hypothetical protein